MRVKVGGRAEEVGLSASSSGFRGLSDSSCGMGKSVADGVCLLLSREEARWGKLLVTGLFFFFGEAGTDDLQLCVKVGGRAEGVGSFSLTTLLRGWYNMTCGSGKRVGDGGC